MTKIKTKKLGVIVKYNGVRLMVVRAIEHCRGCYFRRHSVCLHYSDNLGACAARWRDDNTNIIFRKYDRAKRENKHIRMVNTIK